MKSFVRKESFELSDLDAEVKRVESFKSKFETKSGGTTALAVTLLGEGKHQEGDGHCGATRGGKKKGKRHEGGRRDQGRAQRNHSQQYSTSRKLGGTPVLAATLLSDGKSREGDGQGGATRLEKEEREMS